MCITISTMFSDNMKIENLIFRETIVNTIDNKLKSGDVDDYYLLIAAAIYSHEQVGINIQ